MATQTLTALGTAVVADAAAIATELGGSFVTANVTALGNLLILLGQRKDLSGPALNLLSATDGAALNNR